MKRRHFIQFAGSTLTTLGISQTSFFHQADRYGQAIASSTPRKLALLIGINNYGNGITSLRGCLNDIEMQHELLVHRYGFRSEDIMIVADSLLRTSKQQAPILPTRAHILQAIQEHLIKQAKPGDVVVLHFSGHGATVYNPNATDQNKTSYTIVPNNRQIPNTQFVADISNTTLTLLRQAINTDNITMILDSCHSGGALRGSSDRLRTIASRPNLSGNATLSPHEQELQEELMTNHRLSRLQIQQQKNLKGILIGAVQPDQQAVDAVYDNGKFYAGAFSYLLTRYLWQSTGTNSAETLIKDSLANSLKVQTGEVIPEVQGRDRQRPMYFESPSFPRADAVIQAVKPNGQIDYWLGGESPLQLKSSNAQSIWSIIDRQGKTIGEIEQQNPRNGLRASGKLRLPMKYPIEPGMLLRKSIRSVLPDLKLYLGRHSSWSDPASRTPQQHELEKALKQEGDFIQWVDDNANAECLLGRMTEELRSQGTDESDRKIILNSFGLLTPTHRPLWDTYTQSNEPQDHNKIINRLKHLAAIKGLKGCLGLQSLWESNPPEFNNINKKERKLTSAVVPKGQNNLWETPQQFATETYTQINFRNETRNTPLYIMALTISSDGQLSVLYPQDPADIEMPLTPGYKNTRYDQSPDKKGYPLNGIGLVETIVIAYESPMRGLYDSLKRISDMRAETGNNSIVTTPEGNQVMKMVTGFLNGLDRTTRIRNGNLAASNNGKDKVIDKSTFTVTSHRINIVASIA